MVLSIIKAFKDLDSYTDLLEHVGTYACEINHLIRTEGFDSMEVMTKHISTTMEMDKLLEDTNKSFVGQPPARQVFFGRVNMTRIKACHYFILRCLEINKVPGIRVLDIDMCVCYMASNEKSKDEDQMSHQKNWNKIPPLKGENWPKFRNKFSTMFQIRTGVRGTPLIYVIRHDDGSQDGGGGGLVGETLPDVMSLDVFATQATLKMRNSRLKISQCIHYYPDS